MGFKVREAATAERTRERFPSKGPIGKGALLVLLFFCTQNRAYGFRDPIFEKADWKKGWAEITEYQVSRSHKGKTAEYGAVFTTYIADRFSKSGVVTSKGSKQASSTGSGKAYPVIVHLQQSQIEEAPVSRTASLQLVLRQKPVLQILDFQGQFAEWGRQRYLRLETQGKGSYTLRVDDVRDSVRHMEITEKAVLSVEELFLQLRCLKYPQKNTWKIWLLDPFEATGGPGQPRHAEVEVGLHPLQVLEQPAYEVRVRRDDGKVYFFWISRGGLKQVLMARFPGEVEYRLREIRWEPLREY